MSSTQILVIVLIALVVIVLAGVGWYLMRRRVRPCGSGG